MDDKQIQEITDRISLKLESKGVSPDKNSIFEKLSAYINDFGVVPQEAERKVQSDQYKKYDIPEEHKPLPSFNSSDDVKNICDLAEGDWITIEARVVSLIPPRSPAISQSGILADSTGAIEFIVFAKAVDIETLEPEKWYRFESAIVDSYRGKLNLKLHSGTKITELTDERCLMPATPTPLNNVKVGVIPAIRVKFIDEWESSSDKLAQTGLIADNSGRMKFTIWKSSNKNNLTLGKIYTIYYSVASEFNGRIGITLDTAIILEEEGDGMEDVQIRTKVAAPTEDLPITQLYDLKEGYASVHVKFIEAWETRSEKMLQTGLVGDETSRVKFVIWKDETTQPLELNKVYTIKNAKVDEYNGRLSLALNRATIIPEEGDLEVGTKLEELEGNLVLIAKGSGLIKRCPVEGCGRVLSKQNLCPIHEIQTSFNYDMRIRGILDDGEKTYSIILNREITETMSGMTLEHAIELGTNSSLGLDAIMINIMEKMGGRYLICKGNWFNDQFSVKEAVFKQFDSNEVINLMNQSGCETKEGEQ